MFPAPITQEYAVETGRRLALALRRSGAPEEDILAVEMEEKGGPCPKCGREWVKRHVSGDVKDENGNVIVGLLGEFFYYAPDCGCLADSKVERAKVAGDGGIRAALVAAGVPGVESDSTWKNWDYSVRGPINDAMKRACEWSKSEAWRDGRGIVLCGGVGTGKTRCAVSVMRDAVEKGAKARFVAMADMLGEIIRASGDRGFIEALLSCNLVVIDDLDKVQTDKEWARSQVFAFYDACVREGIALVGTTNLTGMAELSAKFDYSVVSRLAGKCDFVAFGGTKDDDYRILRRRYAGKGNA